MGMVKLRGFEFHIRADGSLLVRKYVDPRGGGNIVFEETFSAEECITVGRGIEAEAHEFDAVDDDVHAALPATADVNDLRVLTHKTRMDKEAAELAKAQADAQPPPDPATTPVADPVPVVPAASASTSAAPAPVSADPVADPTAATVPTVIIPDPPPVSG